MLRKAIWKTNPQHKDKITREKFEDSGALKITEATRSSNPAQLLSIHSQPPTFTVGE